MVTAAPPVATNPAPLVAAGPLAPEAMAEVRRRMVFEHCKWDPQVEDVSVLAPFPLVLAARAWAELARLAEALARETLAAEAELTRRLDLLAQLGLPRRIL
jgi:hypothetical protein